MAGSGRKSSSPANAGRLQISPPFVITEGEIARIAEVFGAAFDAVAAGR
jgi:adenosylmethionine-8-amino-7-oxononanoate aminotransferase